MKHKTYPTYKPSGVEWLGNVPVHWEVKKIKWDTPVLRGASPRPIDDPIYFDDDGEYAWVRIADVTASNVYLHSTTQKLSDTGANLSVKLNPGSLFLSIAATVGVPCIARIKCCIHDGFVHFPLLKTNVKFMFYVFACGESYKGLGKLGTQLNLNTDTIGSIKMAFPSLPEQQIIATFLDRETGKIDILVARQELIIKCLHEKRSAMISHAVTKGLDSSVKLKHSGVEWLGDVPEHWKVQPLKYLLSYDGYKAGPFGSSLITSELLTDGTIKVLSPEHVANNSLQNEFDLFLPEDRRSEMSQFFVKKEDVIFPIVGTLGRAMVYSGNDDESILNQRLARIRVNKMEIIPEYLVLIIAKAEVYKISDILDSKGSILDHITKEKILSRIIALPSLKEQREIIGFLNLQTGRIDDLIAKVEAAIAKLKEYRTALISAAVTGKIDVREVA